MLKSVREKRFFLMRRFVWELKKDFFQFTYDPDDTLRCTSRMHVKWEVVSFTDTSMCCVYKFCYYRMRTNTIHKLNFVFFRVSFKQKSLDLDLRNDLLENEEEDEEQ